MIAPVIGQRGNACRQRLGESNGVRRDEVGRDDWKSEMYSNKLVHFECNSSKDDGISSPLLIFVRLIRMGGSGLGDLLRPNDWTERTGPNGREVEVEMGSNLIRYGGDTL